MSRQQTKYISRKQGKKKLQNTGMELDKNGFFIQNRNMYDNNKVIEYKDSPTGKAYVGIVKFPLRESKHGFEGVILQDEYRQFVQCAECGEWLKKIGTQHLKKCSGITLNEYKNKHGIMKGTRICSDEHRIKMAENGRDCMRNGRKNLYWEKRACFEDRRISNLSRSKQSLEFKNSVGTCPDQIKDTLKEFILTRKRLPHSRNGGSGIVRILSRRYGSYNNALKQFGLPIQKQRGKITEYEFPDGEVYFYHTGMVGNFELIYHAMLSKCKQFFISDKKLLNNRTQMEIKKGDKIRCIDNDQCAGLKLGKIYTAGVVSEDYVQVRSEKNWGRSKTSFAKRRFIKL